MGIKGLTYLIKQKSPTGIQSVHLNTLKNKTVAIDTSIFLYKSLMNVRSNGDYLRNNNDKIVSHIIGLYYKTIQYLSLGITPIYIFDGKPPKEKNNCIQERNKKARDSKEKMKETTDKNEIQKLEKSSIRITKDHIDDLKILFNLMGVSYIHPDGEAEAYAGELCRIGYVDAVITEDMDTLVYETPLMVRSCIDKSIKNNDYISVFNLSQILKDFEMNIEQFTDLCILCGCDYCPSIPKIGTSRAYQNIKKYNSIEKMIESNQIKNIPQGFIDNYQVSRELFKYFNGKIDLNNLPINRSEINFDKLENYLINDCNISNNRVQSSLNKIK